MQDSPEFLSFCHAYRIKPIDVKALRIMWNKIKKTMEWEDEKISLWMESENPLLGGLTPVHLISINRIHKLAKFVTICVEENQA